MDHVREGTTRMSCRLREVSGERALDMLQFLLDEIVMSAQLSLCVVFYSFLSKDVGCVRAS